MQQRFARVNEGLRAGARPVPLARLPTRVRCHAVTPASEEVAVDDVRVVLSCKFATAYGQVVKAVGGTPALGNWDAVAAPTLDWSEGDVWTGEVQLPAGKYEFKMVVFNTSTKHADWEGCANRVLEVPGFPGTLEAPCVWDTPAMETRFTDAPRAVVDPIEAAVQEAVDDGSLAAQEAKLAAARRSIQDTVVQLMNSEEPTYTREQLLAAAAAATSPSASATLSAKAARASPGRSPSPADPAATITKATSPDLPTTAMATDAIEQETSALLEASPAVADQGSPLRSVSPLVDTPYKAVGSPENMSSPETDMATALPAIPTAVATDATSSDGTETEIPVAALEVVEETSPEAVSAESDVGAESAEQEEEVAEKKGPGDELREALLAGPLGNFLGFLKGNK